MHTDLKAGIRWTVDKSIPGVMGLLTITTLLTGGCAMNETQQRTGTGAAIGAIGL